MTRDRRSQRASGRPPVNTAGYGWCRAGWAGRRALQLAAGSSEGWEVGRVVIRSSRRFPERLPSGNNSVSNQAEMARPGTDWRSDNEEILPGTRRCYWLAVTLLLAQPSYRLWSGRFLLIGSCHLTSDLLLKLCRNGGKEVCRTNVSTHRRTCVIDEKSEGLNT